MKTLNNNSIAILLCGLLCLQSLTGCHNQPATKAQAVPGIIVVGIDRSGSTDAVRAEQLDALDSISDSCAINNIPLQVWVFDHKAVCVWETRVPLSRQELNAIKQRELVPHKTLSLDGTRPALLLERIAGDYHFLHAQNPLVLLLSDGDSEDANDTPQFHKVAVKLGERSDLTLAVLGIRPASRSLWEQGFASRLKNRLYLLDAAQSRSGLNDILR